MRVLFVSQFSDMVGGGEHSLLDLMVNLPVSHESVLITPCEGEFARRAARQGIKTSFLTMPKVGFRSLFVLKSWLRRFKEIKPDVIHANNSRAAFYAAIAGRWLGIPVVFHCRIAQQDGLMDMLLKSLVQTVICNSQAVALRFLGSKLPVQVIYNGIKIEPCIDLPYSISAAARTMLFVGRVSQEKQVEKVLQVFATLAAEDARLHLVIVGGDAPQDTEYAQELREFSQHQDGLKRVHWLGDQQDVTPYYAGADVLILTSKHEGFGRVLVEAMAQKLPVAAFAVGGVPEVFEDGVQGMLIKSDDVDAMIDACRKLLSDAGLREKMGIEGEKRALDFSISSHVEQVVAVYQKLLEHKSS